MNKILKIVLIVIVIIVAAIAGAAIFMTRGLDAGAKVKLSGVTPASISDGTYNGEYKAGRWTNAVAVTVKGGKITGIQLKKDVLFVKEGMSNQLFGEVLKAQNTTVDTISSATVTSKAYLKAIENALNK